MDQPALLLDCHKIITWLEQRRKIPKDWYNFEKAAEEKIKFLLRDQQQYADSSIESLVPYLKQHTENFHYCDVVKVVEMLQKSKWAENKSLVFGYSDSRVKQWTKLKKFMQDKQVSIINIAKFISQGLSFDLPSLDKSVELLDNQMTNLKRKMDFNSNAIYQQEKQQLNEKSKMGFNTHDGQNSTVASQIPRLIKEVPNLFKKVEEKFKSIEAYSKQYSEYCAKSGMNDENRLRMIEKFMEKGNYAVNQNGEEIQKVANQDKYRGFEEWKPFDEWGIKIQNESTENSNTVDYQTVLQKRSTKLELIQDLNQLQYFFYGLKHQQNTKSSSTVIQSQNNTNLVESELNEALKTIEQIINLINGDITTRIELKNNAKAYEIVLRKFRNYEQNIEHIKKQNKQYESQIEEIKIKRQETVQQLRNFRARLVRSKNQCEKYLTELIKRQIRITGEINKLE